MKFFSKQQKWKKFSSKYEELKADRRLSSKAVDPDAEEEEEKSDKKKRKRKKEEEDCGVLEIKRRKKQSIADQSFKPQEEEEEVEDERLEEKKRKKKLVKAARQKAVKEAAEEDGNLEKKKKKKEELLKTAKGSVVQETAEEEEKEEEEPRLFSDLPLNERTLAGLKDMCYEVMTPVQQKVIPLFLGDQLTNLIACARTGSGKTLAFLVPAVEMVFRLHFRPWTGTGAIVLCPTRELCVQTFGVLKQLTQHFNFRVGMVMGGVDRKQEAKDLAKGVTILVATPGRLLDHMRSAENFVFKHTFFLVIDEADRILDQGFELQVREIVRLLKGMRVTLLFSATLGPKERDLANRAIQNKDCVVDLAIDDTTPTQLRHSYAIFDPARRFDVLFGFLERFQDRKVMVFFNSCLAVEYFHKLIHSISHLRPLAIHGRMEQSKRMSTFFRFCKAEKAVILCTDVAARGLDIPDVHWIVQFDAPADPKDYVHRVGRTARAGASGQALLFLRPHERGFLAMLQRRFHFLSRCLDPSWSKVTEHASEVTRALQLSSFLLPLARDAFVSSVRAYASHPMKKYFDPAKLELKSEAKNFLGFKKAPDVES